MAQQIRKKHVWMEPDLVETLKFMKWGFWEKTDKVGSVANVIEFLLEYYLETEKDLLPLMASIRDSRRWRRFNVTNTLENVKI